MSEPRIIDQYELRHELGYGGMAVVWRAFDTRLRREVALKVLHDHVAARAENRERFEREARAVARLEHPNIVRIYAVSPPDARTQYIATELIEGPTLRDFVADTGFGLPELGALCCVLVGRALAHAHANGVIHRDVKPENIMLTRDRSPRLMDFGLARVLDTQKLTQTGSILGSPAHMSPELIEGGAIDEGADIFAFGTVLYFCCTRTLPFDGRNPAVILNAILSGQYTPPEQVDPRISPALGAVIARCLQTRRADRYASMDDANRALSEALASCGFDEPEVELQRSARDPEAYREATTARLVESLLREAETALAERRVASAMRMCDRALAYDPHSTTAATLIEQLTARMARRRRMQRAAAALVTIALVVLAALLLGQEEEPARDTPQEAPSEREPSTPIAEAPPAPDDEPRDEPDPAVDAGADNDPAELLAAVEQVSAGVASAASEGSAELARVGPVSPAAVVRNPGRISEGVTNPGVLLVPTDAGEVSTSPQEPEVFDVRIVVSPGAAFVRVNGQAVGQAGDLARRTLSLPRGTHRIEASIEGMRNARIEQEFEVSGPGADLRFRVPWPPAMLEVASDRPGEVFVNDRRVGRTGERIEVPNDGSDSSFEARMVVVPAGGGDPIVREIELRSGQMASVDVRRR